MLRLAGKYRTLIFIFSLSWSCCFAGTADNLSIQVKADSALKILNSHPELAEIFCLDILKESEEIGNNLGLVKANYYLGYLRKRKGDFGKAILYYLEGIRHGSEADYPGASKDRISLLKNSGTVFLKFQDYQLAEKYYDDAMKLAEQEKEVNEFARLIYAKSRLRTAQGQYDEAIALLESSFDSFNLISNKVIALIYNQLGLLYTEKGESDKAQETFQKLLTFIDGKPALIKKYQARTYHNFGNLYLQSREYEKAVISYKMALELRTQNNSKAEDKFITLKDLGEALINTGDMKEAYSYLIQAEDLFSLSKNVPQYYDLHKFLGIVSKNQGDIDSYAKYQEVYAANLESYVAERHEIEATDKKYNLDLITQRYFAMVAEQERNKQITFYSKVGGASLVSLLFMVVGIFYYRRWKLKKDLEQAIKPLTNRI